MKGERQKETWNEQKQKKKKKSCNRRRTKKRVSTFNLEAAVNIKITPIGNVLKMYLGKQKPWYLFVSATKGQNKKKKIMKNI